MTENADKQTLAEACCEQLKRGDGLIDHLDISIETVSAGYARVKMRVQEWMTNGHGTCHGGMIFSLADSAFAFACISENQPNVAASVSIDYLNAAHKGEILTAIATRTAQRGRTGIYDIEVKNDAGTLIALFRGKSQRISGELIATEPSV